MEGAKEFYTERHDLSTSYSGGRYHVSHLVCCKTVRAWAERKKDSPIRGLDIGCGKGVFLRDFCTGLSQTHGIKVGGLVGMDLVKSPGNVFEELPTDLDFVEGNVDGNALPFDSGSFDFVTCNHILEHVFETEQLVEEIRRILRPDGVAVISVPNVGAWINRLLFLLAIQPLGSEVGTRSIAYGFWPERGKAHLNSFNPSGHIRDFTGRGLKDLVEACGFHVRDWWNQDGSMAGKLSKWGSRNMGVVLMTTPTP